jgi:hypothetical protein
MSDHIYSFRVSGKFHITSSANSSAYRRFESIVTPVDDLANSRPGQVSIAEVNDFTNGGFNTMTHSITRYSSNAVNVVVSWNANVQPAIGYLDLIVMANTALGDFSFTPLYT